MQFKDGNEIPADLVVMAAGIRPNTELAPKIGLHCANDGAAASSSTTPCRPSPTRASTPSANAPHRGIAYGLVAPLFEQGKVCATHLAEFGIGRYTGSQTSTKLKVTGIDLFSAGEFMGGDGTEEIVLSDPQGGVYKKLVIKGDKLVGACLYGDTVDGSWYFDVAARGPHVGDIRDRLMFGENQHRRRRPRGPQQGPPRWPIPTRSAAATASPRAVDLQGHQGQRACSRSTRCASTPRPARAAAPAPARSSSC